MGGGGGHERVAHINSVYPLPASWVCKHFNLRSYSSFLACLRRCSIITLPAGALEFKNSLELDLHLFLPKDAFQ